MPRTGVLERRFPLGSVGVWCAESDVPLFQLGVRPAGGAPRPPFVRFGSFSFPIPGRRWRWPHRHVLPPPPVRVTRLAVHPVLDSVPHFHRLRFFFLFPPRHRAAGEQASTRALVCRDGGTDGDRQRRAHGARRPEERKIRARGGDAIDPPSEWCVKNFGA
jgi:hypothetical protein